MPQAIINSFTLGQLKNTTHEANLDNFKVLATLIFGGAELRLIKWASSSS